MKTLKYWVILLSLIFNQMVLADTIVTTYVTKVQEERQSTRFTLTEWLRIKERMKMMDVWLAMFSNPQKDEFKPEINLVYGKTNGVMNYKGFDAAEDDSGEIDGAQAKAQVWLTNLFTGSTGLKLLNIDFGLEISGKQTGSYDPQTEVVFASERRMANQIASGNFRIFGKNIQDSSLVFKVGQYESGNSIAMIDGENKATNRKGLATGAEVQLYLFRWLGLEANYWNFGKAQAKGDNLEVTGNYYDYMAYIEISLLRLMAGYYGENWKYVRDTDKATLQEKGIYVGLKLQI